MNTRTTTKHRVLGGVLALGVALGPVVVGVAMAEPASATVTVSDTQARANGIGWAQNQMGSTAYDRLCQAFVDDA